MKNNGKWMLALHGILLIYAVSGVFIKLAAGCAVGSFPFFLLYGGMLLCLGLYALAWQQIIKRLPLTTAFANKAVTVVWGLVWGVLIFHETVTPGKLTGVALVAVGVILFSKADKEVEKP